jgi:hypothetical protein
MTRRADVAEKSPQKRNLKKAAKSLKEKRADKKQKKQHGGLAIER